MDDCSFEMVVSGNKENIIMVEGEANEIKEEIIVDALKFAQPPQRSSHDTHDFQEHKQSDCTYSKTSS